MFARKHISQFSLIATSIFVAILAALTPARISGTEASKDNFALTGEDWKERVRESSGPIPFSKTGVIAKSVYDFCRGHLEKDANGNRALYVDQLPALFVESIWVAPETIARRLSSLSRDPQFIDDTGVLKGAASHLLGCLAEESGRFDTARHFHAVALRSYQSCLSAENPLAILATAKLIDACVEVGDFRNAKFHCSRTEYGEKSWVSKHNARLLLMLSVSRFWLEYGVPRECSRFLNLYNKCSNDISNNALDFARLRLECELYLSIGNPHEVYRLASQLQEIPRDQGMSQPRWATLQRFKSLASAKTGQVDKGHNYALEAGRIHHNESAHAQIELALDLQALGVSQMLQGRVEKAQQAYDECVTIFQRTRSFRRVGETLLMMAELSLVTGDLSSAQKHGLDARKVFAQTYGTRHRKTLRVDLFLENLKRLDGEGEDVTRECKRIAYLFKANSSVRDPDHLAALYALSQAYAEVGLASDSTDVLHEIVEYSSDSSHYTKYIVPERTIVTGNHVGFRHGLQAALYYRGLAYLHLASSESVETSKRKSWAECALKHLTKSLSPGHSLLRKAERLSKSNQPVEAEEYRYK